MRREATSGFIHPVAQGFPLGRFIGSFSDQLMKLGQKPYVLDEIRILKVSSVAHGLYLVRLPLSSRPGKRSLELLDGNRLGWNNTPGVVIMLLGDNDQLIVQRSASENSRTKFVAC